MIKAKLIIRTKSKMYPIIFGSNILSKIKSILKSNKIFFEKSLIIVDENVPKKKVNLIKKNLSCKIKITHSFISTEKNKNQKNVDKILNLLLKNNFNRNDCVISIGGGIVGDVSAYAASIFKRGIKFINIPTTLLAQVDSSIGGKTGINNRFGKNLVGTFFQPDLVITDTSLLKTLPKRELICGYGEIFKHSLIDNEKQFQFLDKNKFKILSLTNPFIENAIYESCKIKKKIVELDEKETNLRKVLNLGHTFAHSFEASLDYSKKLNHGEAVILGIATAAKFSFINKILNKEDYYKIINHIISLKLPFNLKKFFNIKNINLIIKFMSSDKKNKSSYINLILLKKIGNVVSNGQFSKMKIKKFLYNELIN